MTSNCASARPKHKVTNPETSEPLVENPAKKIRVDEDVLTAIETLHALEPIPRVTGYATGDTTAEVGQVSLGALFGTDLKVIRRLERFAVASNVPGLINIATITNFELFEGPPPSKFGQIMMKNNKHASCVFFSGGVVTRCNLMTGDRNRQICVAPISLTWLRTLASLGKMVGLKHVAIATYMNGISYSTKMKIDPNRQKGVGSARKFKTSAPSGKTIRAIQGGPLEWDAEVPMYDGREPFKLEDFASLPKIRMELEPGSYVLVAYSIGTYENVSGNARAMYNIITRLLLNVQHIILLAKPCSKELDEAKVLDPGHAGVLSDTNEEQTFTAVEVGDEKKDFVL